MKTMSIPLSAVLGPSQEMVVALLNVVVKAVSDHSDVFEYSIDDALNRIHEDVDFGINVISANYPDATNVEYMMVYNGSNCDFMPCNDYTQQVVDIMKALIGEEN